MGSENLSAAAPRRKRIRLAGTTGVLTVKRVGPPPEFLPHEERGDGFALLPRLRATPSKMVVTGEGEVFDGIRFPLELKECVAGDRGIRRMVAVEPDGTEVHFDFRGVPFYRQVPAPLSGRERYRNRYRRRGAWMAGGAR